MKRIDMVKESLNKLNKEQLISIILEADKSRRGISGILVRQSKWEIEDKDACERIRKCMCDTKYMDDLENEHLGNLIDCDNGKISIEKYREIVLGDDEEDLEIYNESSVLVKKEHFVNGGYIFYGIDFPLEDDPIWRFWIEKDNDGDGNDVETIPWKISTNEEDKLKIKVEEFLNKKSLTFNGNYFS